MQGDDDDDDDDDGDGGDCKYGDLEAAKDTAIVIAGRFMLIAMLL